MLDITLKPGIDKKYGVVGQLDTSITANIKDTVNNEYMKLFWYESFFNPDLPDDKDVASGASRVNKPEDKILLRVAYSIWSSR